MSDPLSDLLDDPAPATDGSDRMWPLDIALAGLSVLILVMIFRGLDFGDPRWQYNGWTYVVAVPLLAIGLSLVLRAVANRYVEKSVQFGFLFSVFVHLLLIVVAVYAVIFPHYFPEAFAGVKPERSPIRKTVPDYLFKTPEQTEAVTPDWSAPVDAETTSRVVPMQERELPPMQRSAPKLEVPQPQRPPVETKPMFLLRRPEPQPSMPKPATSASRLARRRPTEEAPPSPPSFSSPRPVEVPDSPAPAPATPSVTLLPQPPAAQPTPAGAAPSARLSLSPPAPSLTDDLSAPISQPALQRPTRDRAMPAIGSLGLSRSNAQRTPGQRAAPLLSAPTPPTVSIARRDLDAPRMVSPMDSPQPLVRQSPGASVLASPEATNPSPGTGRDTGRGEATRRLARNSAAGLPDATVPSVQRPRGKRSRASEQTGIAGAADGPASELSRIDQLLAAAAEQAAADPQMRSAPAEGPASDQPADAAALSMAAAQPMFDVKLPDDTMGLGREPADDAGIVASQEKIELASLDLSQERRPRRQVGGPVTPAGQSVAAVESFSRRVQRTNGGAAPAPAGAVGPATEQAIELGLTFLASRQNIDGSWSLQGHGDNVLLRSDTAATGLCLLAFQGAGYTHRQHQYAATVARGIEYLKSQQKSNGDLYRRENPVSDQNVAFYSHGIAALALCEAYGMTQDPDLQSVAQSSLDFIAATQHRRRGGWRYEPQVSSDTSVTGWMMMALKSGELSGLRVDPDAYAGIDRWLELSKDEEGKRDRYRYNPFAPDTPSQRHGRKVTPTMTAVGNIDANVCGMAPRQSRHAVGRGLFGAVSPTNRHRPRTAPRHLLLVLCDPGDVSYGRRSLGGLEPGFEPNPDLQSNPPRSRGGELGPRAAGARPLEHPRRSTLCHDHESVEPGGVLSTPADL